MDRNARVQELLNWLNAFKYQPQTPENLGIIAWFELEIESIRAEKVAA